MGKGRERDEADMRDERDEADVEKEREDHPAGVLLWEPPVASLGTSRASGQSSGQASESEVDREIESR